MTRVMLIAALLAIFCSLAVTQSSATTIRLTSDAQGTSCTLVDQAGFIDVHVWVQDSPGILAIQFYAPIPNCWGGAQWTQDDVTPYIFIGNSQDPDGGLSVAFGQCLDGDVHVGRIVVTSHGQAGNCCNFPILKAANDGYPDIDGPIVVDCENFGVLGAAVGAVVNSDGICSCEAALPTEKTNWGKIKALYK